MTLKKRKILPILALLLFLSSWITANETIIKCAKDMESSSEEIRQQAAMILGQYNDPTATEVLVKHLTDKSALVRRAVLVSLQDRAQQRMLNLSVMLQMIGLMRDPDVEVRRLASTTAQFSANIFLQGRYMSGDLTDKQQSLQQKEVRSILLQALQDPDEIVRLNTITIISTNYSLIFEKAFSQAIVERTNDSLATVVIIALRILPSIQDFDIKPIAQKLSTHENTDVCLGLIQVMVQKEYKDQTIWDNLCKSTNLDIKANAILGAMELKLRTVDTLYKNFITDPTNPVTLRSKMLPYLPRHAQKTEIIQNLLEDKNSQIRIEAVRISPLILSLAESEKLLLPRMSDSSLQAQLEIASVLLQRATAANQSIFQQLFKSDGKNIRLQVLERLKTLHLYNEEIVIEGMLDDEKEIRLKAISLCIYDNMSNPSLREMLLRTMEDEDPEMQLETLKVFSNHLNETELKGLAQKKLNDPKTNTEFKTILITSLKKYPTEEIKKILTDASNNPDPKIAKEAILALYQSGDKSKDQQLIPFLLSKDTPITERIALFNTVSQNKENAQKTMAMLLYDSVDLMRENAIKFFNVNQNLYLEEYFNAVFEEKKPLIIQITCNIYINKGFQNITTVQRLLASPNYQLKRAGQQTVLLNYTKEFLPILQTSFASADIRDLYFAIEASRLNAVVEMEQPILNLLKKQHEPRLRMQMLGALLRMNTEPAKEYLKTITKDHPFYNDYQLAIRYNQTDETHSLSKPNGKSR